jgi:CRISPR system Cascade subunit CasA
LVAYYFAGVRLESLRAELAARLEIVGIWEKRLAVGEAGRPELEAARAETSGILAAIANADGAVELGRAGIADAAGIPTTAIGARPLDVRRLAELPSPGELPLNSVRKAGLVHRSDIRRKLADYDAADVAVRLQLAERYPNLSVNPSYLFQEGFSSYVLGGALDALPVFHRGQGQIAERKAARDKIAVEFLALQSEVRDKTDAALTKYRAAVAEWSTVGGVGVRQQNAREASAAAALRAGEADRLDLASAKLGKFPVQRAEIDALERGQLALGELEDAVQGALGGLMRMGELK